MENSVFAQTSDTIYLNGSTLKLSGTNYFSSNILTESGSTITVVNGSVGFLPHYQDSSADIFDLNKLEYASGTAKSYAVEVGNITSDGTYYLAKNIKSEGSVILYLNGMNVGSLDLYNQSTKTYCYDSWSYTLQVSNVSGVSCLSVSRVETENDNPVIVKAGETRSFDSGYVFENLS